MSKNIHPTAIIGDNVKIGEGTKIGAYSVIEGNISIGENCNIHNHVSIKGNTTIGNGNVIYPFASIGSEPQDLKYNGEPDVCVEIGNNNKIREYVTINSGTVQDKSKTTIGSNCLFMIGSHIAHDCIIEDRVILANNATIAGHVHIGTGCVIGGLSAIHQFVRIGRGAMIGGMSGIESDVIPFGIAYGERASLQGLNLVGLKRGGFSRSEISSLRKLYKSLFATNNQDIIKASLKEKIGTFTEENKNSLNDKTAIVLEFLKDADSRAICQPKE